MATMADRVAAVENIILGIEHDLENLKEESKAEKSTELNKLKQDLRDTEASLAKAQKILMDLCNIIEEQLSISLKPVKREIKNLRNNAGQEKNDSPAFCGGPSK